MTSMNERLAGPCAPLTVIVAPPAPVACDKVTLLPPAKTTWLLTVPVCPAVLPPVLTPALNPPPAPPVAPDMITLPFDMPTLIPPMPLNEIERASKVEDEDCPVVLPLAKAPMVYTL